MDGAQKNGHLLYNKIWWLHIHYESVEGCTSSIIGPQGRHSSGSALAYFGLLFWLKCLLWIHPWRLMWNIIMEVWKIIFLSKCVICRFRVNLPGCKRKCILDFYKKCRICILPQGPQNHKPFFTQQPPITWKRHDKKHPKKPKILFWLVVWLNPSEKYSYSSNWTLSPSSSGWKISKICESCHLISEIILDFQKNSHGKKKRPPQKKKKTFRILSDFRVFWIAVLGIPLDSREVCFPKSHPFWGPKNRPVPTAPHLHVG